MRLNSSGPDVKGFTESFFRKLGATVSWSSNRLLVSDVPSNFEAFVGRSSPYSFSFSSESALEDDEILAPGSYFLNAMAEFLKSESKVSLIKIDCKIDPAKEVNERFTFENANIEGISASFRHDFVFRFTFSTTYQYLNKSLTDVKSLFVREGEISELDFSQFGFVSGVKSDVKIESLDEEYGIAKERVRNAVNEKKDKIAVMLSSNLKKELFRVETHFNQQIKESDDQKVELSNVVDELISAVDPKLVRKREKAEKDLIKMSDPTFLVELEKERNYCLKDERVKHGLNIATKLLNTSILYIPNYNFSVKLAGERTKGIVQLNFDPLQRHMAPLICPATNKQLYKVFIDDEGTPCSKESLVQCIESNKFFCSSSMSIICAHSGKPVHKNFAKKASDGKWYAKSYVADDCMTGRSVPRSKLMMCAASGLFTTSNHFTKCPKCQRSVCPRGLTKSFVKGGVVAHCKLCKP